MKRAWVVAIVSGLVTTGVGIAQQGLGWLPVGRRNPGLERDGPAAVHAGNSRGACGHRRQVSRRPGHRQVSGRRVCRVLRGFGGRGLQPLGHGRRQTDHEQVGRGAAGQRWPAVTPADSGGGGNRGLHGWGQFLPPAEEREGGLRLRPTLLPLLHEVQPAARPHSPLRQRFAGIPPSHPLASGRRRGAA